MGKQLTVKKIEATNALDFFKYAEIYSIGEIKRYLLSIYEGVIYVLGLELDGQPLSFIVVERRNNLHHVCTTYYIQNEIGTLEYEGIMLKEALAKSKAEGAEHFYISYFQNNKESDRLKKLYESHGFKPSGYVRCTFVMDRQEIGMAIQRISSRYSRYLHSYRQKLRTLKDLSPEIIRVINAQRGTEIPNNFYPLTKAYHPECTTMILQDNDPAGWIVFEANGKTALYIHHLFIKEKYRNNGLFIPLLVFAYQHIPEAITRFFFYVNGNNNNMLGLMKLFKNGQPKTDALIEMTREI